MTSDPNLPSENPIYSCLQYLHFHLPSIDFQFSVRNFNLPPADSNDYKFTIRNFNLPFVDSNYHSLPSEISIYRLTIQMITSLASGISIYYSQIQIISTYYQKFQFNIEPMVSITKNPIYHPVLQFTIKSFNCY